MAARTRKILHDEDTRKRIKAAAIIDRLQAFVLGDSPDAMSRSQVAAAILLLNKVLANPLSAEVTPYKSTTYVIRAPPECESHEEWIRLYGPKTAEVAPASVSPLEGRTRIS